MAGHHGLWGRLLSSWRNTGLEGFVETTDALGLSGAINGTIASMLGGDMDGDCDSDLVLTLADQSVPNPQERRREYEHHAENSYGREPIQPIRPGRKSRTDHGRIAHDADPRRNPS